MPPPQYRSGPDIQSRRRDGVALIIVLAFVVIITGVILAFFSRAIANRAISNASANQTKADLLAQGAADDIIGDLQAEIVAGSTVTTATSSSGTVLATIYTPSSPALMVPQLAGTNGIANPAPNLVLRSASGNTQNFFSSGGTTIPFNAVAVSSTSPSLNGRSVSLARWNAPYYLPLATGSDATPATGSFAPPDWVLVARNGSTPTQVTANTATSATNSTTVIGRYAYAIYNEGNLLDANVAGYPSTTNTNTQSSYKPVLAYADLTQVGLTQGQIDQLVAWRNYASATVPGASYQNPQFTGSSASNYYSFAISNPSGFLAVSSTGLNPGNSNGLLGPKGQSDRMFGSRQELISFFENGLGISGTALGALNYFTTFTRGLNQPSVWRDPSRPLVQQTGISQIGGGNNAQGAEDASQVSDPINPSFLNVRVTGAFTRNDGSTAVVGEPFVKKRFALSKLAWLTYLGPSALRTPASAWAVGASNPGVTNINYDMWAMVNLYGISPAYLAQGTTNNITNYFGLVWQKDGTATQGSFHDGEYKWYYAGHNNLTSTSLRGVTSGGPGSGPPLPGTPGVSNPTGSISRIVDIANLGSTARDPDFFELLKAAVAAGSKAKGSMSQPAILTGIYGLPGSVSEPYYYQVFRDTSLDYAILQLGANIIDQFKVDGYSTRIVFNDGGRSPQPD